ncbi:CPBP family intramembrane metalloprotease [Olleya aquimaris]|uniref:CPBP family intramembrane metalloprotease n=1 Tax=Olleya sediminilitoris TaxID=2795739 RepID=A0ABS1WI79_9FLAO|nr:CPBP family intramembrane glutamic endopeptidase [Olleya sediminilitoris]AXO79421.1 CPBP family intramembrane metalloprotease [Olleya aquimaris]MBL7558814.1 CPBP family intramembrane metalloprotease [Olleya sediminilitoris]
MDFIKQAFKVKHEFWRYLIGSLIIAIFALIGQVPFTIAAIMKHVAEGGSVYAVDEQRLMTILEPNLNLFLLLLSFAFGFLGLIIVVKYLHKQTMLSVTTARLKVDWKRVMFAFLFWGLISSGMIIIDYFASPENYVWNFELERFLILLVIAILLIPIQTSLEEYIFRGYLMQGFGLLAKNRWFPLLMTSVIFGGMHVFNPEVAKLGYGVMVYYIGTGLFLGILTLMDEGMELALGFHAANNLFGALLLTSDWTVLQTHSVLKDVAEPGAGFGDIIIPVFVVFPILLFIFAKVYKWTNWKDKLFGKIEEPVENDYTILD